MNQVEKYTRHARITSTVTRRKNGEREEREAKTLAHHKGPVALSKSGEMKEKC